LKKEIGINKFSGAISRPFFYIAVFTILGISAGYNFEVNVFVSYFFVTIFIVLSFLFRRSKFFFIPFIILCLFLGLLRFQVFNLGDNFNISKLDVMQDNVVLTGCIVNEPQSDEDKYGRKRVIFDYKVDHLLKDDSLQQAKGLLRVYCYKPSAAKLKYGNAYCFEGDFIKRSDIKRRGAFNYQTYLKSRNLEGLLYINAYDGVIPLERKVKVNPIYKGSMRLRTLVRKKYDLLFNEPYNTLLAALLLGERSDLEEEVFNSFINSGAVHMLAISGLHVGIIIIFIIFSGKLFGLKLDKSAIICLTFLIFYCFLTGGRISVLRAAIMSSVILIGWIIKRDSDIYNSLGLAAFLLLMYNPYYLFDIGFQLSFVSVISIVYLYPKIELFGSWFAYRFFGYKSDAEDAGLNKNNRFGIIKKYMLNGFYVSLAASLSVAPLSLYYFNRVSLMSIFSNLIMAPLLTLSLLLGLLVSIISFFSMSLSKIFSEALWLFLSLMLLAAKMLGGLAYSVIVINNFNINQIVIYYCLIIFIFHIDKLSFLKKMPDFSSLIES
jgi:competence protein ComEC